MKTFKGRTAVVTGAASGLGRAMAERFAREGMHVVLADVDRAALANVEENMRAHGARVLPVSCDVSKAGDVENLARATLREFGGVHLVANNAGVSPLGAVWENTVADWEWTLGVNLWGVIHGVRVFTPLLLHEDEAHIVNTASVAGLISPPGMGVYNVTKHAVVALTETLHHDLAHRGATNVKCSVLCPAYVPTGIAESERTRPEVLKNPGARKTSEQRELEAALKKAVQSGKISAAQVADAVFEAVRDERFYILTHDRIKPAIEARMHDILAGAEPRDPLRIR